MALIGCSTALGETDEGDFGDPGEAVSSSADSTMLWWG